jgi:hypothetical protein
MTNLQYLEKVLEEQNLTDEQQTELAEKSEEVESFLLEKLDGVAVTVKWAGSIAKKTMIRANYDADLVVYVHSDETGVGDTLDDIYDTIQGYLNEKYVTIQKTSAIRLLGMNSFSILHVDVVPGRFFDDTKTDTWLHRTTGDKCRFKTNLKVHLDTIKNSGVRPLIRLMKLWASRNGIQCPTFILELLTIKLAEEVKSEALTDQVIHVFEQLKSNGKNICVEDPANPSGNDLSEPLDGVKFALSYQASYALQMIEADQWDAVFGPVAVEETAKIAALQSVAIHIANDAKPWGDA